MFFSKNRSKSYLQKTLRLLQKISPLEDALLTLCVKIRKQICFGGFLILRINVFRQNRIDFNF